MSLAFFRGVGVIGGKDDSSSEKTALASLEREGDVESNEKKEQEGIVAEA